MDAPEELTEAEILAHAAEERRHAKNAMLARNAARISDLTNRGLLRDGETLEQYDTRREQEAS